MTKMTLAIVLSALTWVASAESAYEVEVRFEGGLEHELALILPDGSKGSVRGDAGILVMLDRSRSSTGLKIVKPKGSAPSIEWSGTVSPDGTLTIRNMIGRGGCAGCIPKIVGWGQVMKTR